MSASAAESLSSSELYAGSLCEYDVSRFRGARSFWLLPRLRRVDSSSESRRVECEGGGGESAAAVAMADDEAAGCCVLMLGGR
jgi:hypothetical protein